MLYPSTGIYKLWFDSSYKHVYYKLFDFIWFFHLKTAYETSSLVFQEIAFLARKGMLVFFTLVETSVTTKQSNAEGFRFRIFS